MNEGAIDEKYQAERASIMGKIWFHIGSPKTGTTSLQTFLKENSDELREQGNYNYVNAGRAHIAHNKLASAARMGEASRVFDNIGREADALPDATHIVSSELLFNSYTARKLSQTVPDHIKDRGKVICYVRRQDSYLEAMYKQLLKNSRIKPDRQAFLGDAKRLVRYLDTLNTYSAIFGQENVIVRPYSRDRLKNGDIVHDFAEQTGLNLFKGLRMQTDFSNKTFSAEMSELLALMGEKTDYNTREIIRELIAINHPGTIKSRDVFTKAERRELMDTMQRENRRIVRRFMPQSRDFFATEDLHGEEEVNVNENLQMQVEDRTAAMEAMVTAIGNLQRRRAEERELADAVPEPTEVIPANDIEEETAPPSWYREIYPGGAHSGWFHSFGTHSCSFVDRTSDQLVVSFDNLSQAGNDAYAREPWAQKFCADRGYSHVGVYAQTPSWYRDAELIAYLEHLRDTGFFKQFKRVAFVGTSMGAFAALTFSDLAPGATVLAFSPQTTLIESESPFETRFAKGRANDWSLPYSDAAQHTSKASAIYLVYDVFHKMDTSHIKRLPQDNLIHLKAFGMGHKTALTLSRMDLLKQVMEDGITGTLKPSEFYQAIRKRKDVYLYRQAMETYLQERGQANRATRFGNAFKRRRRLAAKAA